MSKHDHLYGTMRWKQRRKRQLQREPLCAMCAKAGRVVLAMVADHIRPHHGDLALFWDPDNLQSLCFTHHNSSKQSVERIGYDKQATGPDGWPLDPMHPANRRTGRK
jgi:5-methylcytosine-specific restriction enzyme A